jgi:mono-ADP-ribosyltransferase sirtuin 6
LDWEDPLPQKELGNAEMHSKMSDLCICLGTTLQINPAGEIPLYCKQQKSGKLVICNLQPTKLDDEADLVIHGYVDHIMERVWKEYKTRKPRPFPVDELQDFKAHSLDQPTDNHIH